MDENRLSVKLLAYVKTVAEQQVVESFGSELTHQQLEKLLVVLQNAFDVSQVPCSRIIHDELSEKKTRKSKR